MKVVISRRVWITGVEVFLVIVLCIGLASCIGLMPSPFRPSPGPKKIPQAEDLAQAFDIIARNFRLGPDDIVSVNFQTKWSIPPGSYKLDTLDEIDIEFFLDPDLNRKVAIRPDGMITLPGIGDVSAVGLTPEELADRISKRLIDADIIKGGDIDARLRKYKLVTVSVTKFYQKIEALVRSLTTLTNGQVLNVTVNPDGTIDMPLLKERIIAVGQTVPDVEATINRLYRMSELKNVVASLALNTAKSRKVYILGEVTAPGAYDIRQPITALQALALAAGPKTDVADLTSVILVSKDINGKPIGRRLDLKRVLDVGDMTSAIMVKPYDVIYVPRTYIADLDLFMVQYFSVAQQVSAFLVNIATIQGYTSTATTTTVAPVP
ncbi:MAG: polysaccharide biosynthesis/export family protein [Deltaproteobacteria bacterium]|nr:polysaccharide biosynthesis/export family protein [Deltaproteobacteria bacterium]